MKILIVILLMPLLSGCMNIWNHATVGTDFGLWPWVILAPDYDELMYSGTRAIGSGVTCRGYEDFLVTAPILIIGLPLEIVMDTMTFPYDIYQWKWPKSSRTSRSRERELKVLFEKAEQGDAGAQYSLGMFYVTGKKDEQEAVKWFRKAAEQGYEPAKDALREMGKE